MTIDEDDFFSTYRPKANHFADEIPDDLDVAACMFETSGDELNYIEDQEPNQVWTLVEEDGADRILAGQHNANRVGYLVTEVPWSDKDTVVDLE